MALATRHWDRTGNGGLTFTELGLGTAPIANLYRAVSDEDAQAVLDRAWEAGVRYFDTAPLYGYGLAETRLNRFLRGKPRDEYMLSTKVGRLLKPVPPDQRTANGRWFDTPSRTEVYDYSYDGVMRSVEMSMERLGMDRIDILYAHDLDLHVHQRQTVLDKYLRQLISGGYRALLDLRDQKVIRAFGGGLNQWQPCQWLAERGDFDLFLLAGRYTLLEQEAIESFLPLCASRGIGIVIGAPYNSGILATGPAETARYDYKPAPPEVVDRVARIEALCGRHRVRLLDAALQFPLGHPSVLSVIPGARNRTEMDKNLTAVGATIPSALWEDLKAAGLLHPDCPTTG